MTSGNFIFLDPEGNTTRAYAAMLDDLVHSFLDAYHLVSQSPREIGFYAVGVYSPLGDVSYWGILDMVQTPEEDIYPLVDRYMYAAMKTLGEAQIAGYGLVDLGSVIRRTPFQARFRA